ncbi:hypothetical protein AAG570_002426 [Ranatra chinensis]|uniref:Uncharacterized protein n=1 Tax=Ranatra chinensis TaxID=642074 RepID=A0ABD0Y7H1_9HEMI
MFCPQALMIRSAVALSSSGIPLGGDRKQPELYSRHRSARDPAPFGEKRIRHTGRGGGAGERWRRIGVPKVRSQEHQGYLLKLNGVEVEHGGFRSWKEDYRPVGGPGCGFLLAH